jgi:hypothetical protein
LKSVIHFKLLHLASTLEDKLSPFPDNVAIPACLPAILLPNNFDFPVTLLALACKSDNLFALFANFDFVTSFSFFVDTTNTFKSVFLRIFIFYSRLRRFKEMKKARFLF